MTLKKIRIATRQSPLALWQANHVRELLLKQWPDITVELLPMVTSGDKFLMDKLLAAGGKGLFVKELEEALLSNRADIAVHSTKDMPAELPDGLSLAAICERHNPFDALISKHYASLDALPPQAIVGTASLRRQSQLLAYRSDLQIKTLRGNINTRLAKLEAGEYDAIILATAGLERMGLEHIITERLSAEVMLPTCGQGALCIECRTDDQEIQQLIAGLNDPLSSLCVQAERSVNAQLGGNCHVPLAVFCTFTSPDQLFLRAKILSLDGTQLIEDSQKGGHDQAQTLAKRCTESLLAKGAADLLDSIPL
ncbi:hydroxymethylbilane synthase [Legionella maioricensis]|uniref:Porphobilinogen deaminase n=1 Tax=Legionella maioricensis TaxID=2896528 RepID=A0A9X2D3I1_9GAMM|nr:hydroxymethylbilane synthase [Legionella maioricensis]MCL9685798.1 hydroxymethylbilane synthase [Legionella maioricensis]MCL9689215.1 hydroxymethylbilane synthase [Legionella maioricensis]